MAASSRPPPPSPPPPVRGDREQFQLLQSQLQPSDVLESLGSIDMALFRNTNDADHSEGCAAVRCTDVQGEGRISEANEADIDDYVVVEEEDAVDSMACFMATYLKSMKDYKELPPDQLKKALDQAFLKKKRSTLRKAWERSKTIYKIASYGTTAVGMCQNRAVLTAASFAFRTSCRAVSKLL